MAVEMALAENENGAARGERHVQTMLRPPEVLCQTSHGSLDRCWSDGATANDDLLARQMYAPLRPNFLLCMIVVKISLDPVLLSVLKRGLQRAPSRAGLCLRHRPDFCVRIGISS